MSVATKKAKRGQSEVQSGKARPSPRNGNVLPVPGPNVWRAGRSGNPEGSSAKQRMLAKIEEAATDDECLDAALNQFKIAKSFKMGSAAVAAFAGINKALGVYEEAATNLNVRFDRVVVIHRGDAVPLPISE